jgi:arylsulfatase A-like enzyme
MLLHPKHRVSRLLAASRFLVAALLAVGPVAGSGCGEPEPARPSVVFLVLDTVRADRVGAWGHPEARTPNLDRITRRGTMFSEASSTSSWTLPATVSLLTGLYPSAHGVTDISIGIPPGLPTAPRLFRDAGYETAAFVSTNLVGTPYGFQQGVEVFDERNALGHRHVSSRSVTDLALAWLRGEHMEPFGALDGDGLRDPVAPFFLLAHYYDPHWVWLPHPRFVPAIPVDAATGEPEPLGLYDSEIAYLDHHVGRLLRGIQAVAPLEDVILVMVADHGEAFGQHGVQFHTETLYQELVHVPLAIAGPGFGRGIVADPVSTVHVLPTVLEAAGLGERIPVVQGEPVLDGATPVAGLGAPSEVDWIPYHMYQRGPDGKIPYDPGKVRRAKSLRVGDWKAIRNDLTGEWELYDLARDPLELDDLSAREPEHLAELRGRLEELLASSELLRAAMGDASLVELDAGLRAKLEALGYLE